jgi:hypothetical protein
LSRAPGDPPAPADGGRGGAAADYVLLAAGLLILLFAPHQIVGDGLDRFQALDALLDHGEVSRTPYALVGPLFSAPLWLLGRLGPSEEWWCARYNWLLFALGLVALDRLLRGAVPDRVRRTFLLLLVFASMFPHHVQHYFGEVFTAVLAAAGILAVWVRRSPWGWACLALATANTPAAVVGLALVAAGRALETRRWRYGLAVVGAVGLILLESWLRRGHPLVSGYEGNHGESTVLPYSGRPGFSYPFFFGVLSILLSFGKGLVFYAPGLLLPVPAGAVSAEARSAWRGWLLLLAGLVLVYAQWWSWYGGWFWGPRFFLFASVPASFALAVGLHEAPRQSLVRNLLTLALLALSFWVGLDGLAFGQHQLAVCVTADYAHEYLAWYVPEFSALCRPFVEPPEVEEEAGLALAAGLVAAVYVGCFLHLAGSLLATCVRQAVERLRRLRDEGSRRGPWRF